MSEPVDDIVWEDVVLDGISVIEDATDSTNKPMSTSDDNLYFVDLPNNSSNKDTNVDMGNKDMMDSMKKRGRPPKKSLKNNKTTDRKQQSSSPVNRVKNRKNSLSRFWLKRNKSPNSAEKSAARMNINISTADDNFSPLDVETADMHSLSSDQHSDDLDNTSDTADIVAREDIEVKNEKQNEGFGEKSDQQTTNASTSTSLIGAVQAISTISATPRKRGRPPKQAESYQFSSTSSKTLTAKKRGRPAGSTNKKNYSITMSNIASSPGFVVSSVVGQKRESHAPVKLMINSLRSDKTYNNSNSSGSNTNNISKSTASTLSSPPQARMNNSVITATNKKMSNSAAQKRKHNNDVYNNSSSNIEVNSSEVEQQPKKRGRPPVSATTKLFSNRPPIDYEANNIFDVKCSVVSDNAVVGKSTSTLRTEVKRGRGRLPKQV